MRLSLRSCNNDNVYLVEEDCTEIMDVLDEYDSSKLYLNDEFIYLNKSLCDLNSKKKNKEFEISKEAKQLIELIYRKFGNYPIQDLGRLVDEIVSRIPLKNLGPINKIDFYDFNNFLIQNVGNEKLKNNIIYKFVLNFDRLDIYKSYGLDCNILTDDKSKSLTLHK